MQDRILEDELMSREEDCRKAIKTVVKAIFMRIFVLVLLLWIFTKTAMELWVIGMIAFVLLLTAGGMLPLLAEFKKRRAELKSILEQYE